MSEALSALQGARAKGDVSVEETGPQGMITLRADLAGLEGALGQLGLTLPGPRQIVQTGERSAAWMSPDELLIVLPYAQVPQALAALHSALEGRHFLAVNVSDARALFTLTGVPGAVRETLAKLAPVDLAPGRFEPGELRRTRLAQIPAALWLMPDGSARVICFRSVAQYAFDLLKTAAAAGPVKYF
ncbi:sarcosine oxidase subunit gamma [Thalassobius sp. S69A]|uniref:sarcosine oxidase subunit gamma n=1 Tax=unclassified Thalassovita TaxID=2619711 RepID=UPI000C0F14AB|nr:sarcosine oxidase subunit gamma [Paracoccaceae bacterium]MBT25736.1 sarcosine oxidase subunit gamma [Paracoccaceae bacterium]